MVARHLLEVATAAADATYLAWLAMIDPDPSNKFACGFLGSTDPQYLQLSSNLITPELNVRPDGAGRLLLQTPDLDDRADPAYETDTDGLIGREMLA